MDWALPRRPAGFEPSILQHLINLFLNKLSLFWAYFPDWLPHRLRVRHDHKFDRFNFCLSNGNFFCFEHFLMFRISFLTASNLWGPGVFRNSAHQFSRENFQLLELPPMLSRFLLWKQQDLSHLRCLTFFPSTVGSVVFVRSLEVFRYVITVVHWAKEFGCISVVVLLMLEPYGLTYKRFSARAQLFILINSWLFITHCS